MDSRALIALAFTVIVWGGGPVFIRTLSLDLGAGDHLAIRYSLVGFAYAAGLASTGGWRIARRDWPRLVAVSLIGMLGYNLGSAYGFERVPAGIGSLIIGTQPLLIALLGAAVAAEKLTPMAIAGLAVAFAGTVLLVWSDLGAGSDAASLLIGCGLVFLSGCAWAVYVVAAKPLILEYGSYPVTALSVAIASLAMLALLARPATLATVEAMTARNWLDMAYMAVLSTFIATLTWNYGASRLSAAAAGAFLYLVPVIGVVAGAAMLGEAVTAAMLAGGGLILIGVGLAQAAPRLRRRFALTD